MSQDFTRESEFQGKYESWINNKINSGLINMIKGDEIGTVTTHGEPVIVDELMSNNYLSLNKNMYGILIPSDEILKRNKFEWFARASEKQVLESNTILGNYILSCIGNNKGKDIKYFIPNKNR
jgi:hypothetical protein